MADAATVRAKWQRVMATNKSPEAQQAAREALAQLGSAPEAPKPMAPTSPRVFGSDDPTRPPESLRRPSRQEDQAARIQAGNIPEPSTMDKLGAAANGMGTDLMNGIAATGAGFNEGFAFGLPAKGMDLLGLSSPQLREQQKAAAPIAALGGTLGASILDVGHGADAAVGRGVSA